MFLYTQLKVIKMMVYVFFFKKIVFFFPPWSFKVYTSVMFWMAFDELGLMGYPNTEKSNGFVVLWNTFYACSFKCTEQYELYNHLPSPYYKHRGSYQSEIWVVQWLPRITPYQFLYSSTCIDCCFRLRSLLPCRLYEDILSQTGSAGFPLGRRYVS